LIVLYEIVRNKYKSQFIVIKHWCFIDILRFNFGVCTHTNTISFYLFLHSCSHLSLIIRLLCLSTLVLCVSFLFFCYVNKKFVKSLFIVSCRSLWPCHKITAPVIFFEFRRSIRLRQGPFGLHFLCIVFLSSNSISSTVLIIVISSFHVFT
jgi:hypothetical protein